MKTLVQTFPMCSFYITYLSNNIQINLRMTIDCQKCSGPYLLSVIKHNDQIRCNDNDHHFHIDSDLL